MKVKDVVKILNYLSGSSGPVGFNEIGERVGISSPSTLSRSLNEMSAAELIRREGRGYVMGEGAVALARTVLGHLSPRERVQPILDELALKSGESAAFFQYSGRRFYLIARSLRPDAYHYCAAGEEVPRILRNLFSRAALSLMDPEDRELVFKHYEIGDGEEACRKGLIKAEEPYFLEEREGERLFRLAVPVYGERGDSGAVGITSFYPERCQEELDELLRLCRAAAFRIEALLTENPL